MFEGFRKYIFLARVQAELQAQYDDKNFVNQICLLPSNVEQINIIREHAYYRKKRIAPFLTVCHILNESMFSADLSCENRKICAGLLSQRILKADADHKFRFKYIMIFIELENNLKKWIEENDFS